MKSLAEQLREFMDQVKEAQPQAVAYDLTMTIPNWKDPVSDDDDEWQEEVEVGVNYRVGGHDVPGNRSGHPDTWTPNDNADLYINGVFNLDTGEEVKDQLSEYTLGLIDDAVNADIQSKEGSSNPFDHYN